MTQFQCLSKIDSIQLSPMKLVIRAGIKSRQMSARLLHVRMARKCGDSQRENAQETMHANSVMKARAALFEPHDQFHGQPSMPTVSCEGPSIGQDRWRQLKRVQIHVVSGDKRAYQRWKAAFLACIDSARATGEYELPQLRQYLAGKALKTIENQGHSGPAYEAPKNG